MCTRQHKLNRVKHWALVLTMQLPTRNCV
ncbi:hypothetical protein MED222_05335 [Vibrio sp. MED222]|nr:hypothetical protein MED222_05335 [Vibrio sp. MED222]